VATFFIADAAHRLGIPVVMAVHEHFTLAEWWPFTDTQIEGSYAFTAFREALKRAHRLVFEARATQDFYRDMLGIDNGELVYYGIDVSAIEAYLHDADREALRAEIGVTEDTTLIVNIGMFEPRKSQAMLVDVFDRVARRHPDAELLLVGAGKDPYTEALNRVLEHSRPADGRIRTLPVTRDIRHVYAAADLLVSASDIESMPRSFMEAMAFGLPIVSTDVAGCPELVVEDHNGWTAPVRTSVGIEMALERALDNAGQWHRFGERGRELLQARHSVAAHGTRIANLLREASGSRLAGSAPAALLPPV
jgi:glycosyltransferase involved in cell wall biosynthesis